MSKTNEILYVEGMTCANCAKSISKSLSEKEIDAFVDFGSGEVSFDLDKEQHSLDEIKNDIEKLGFKVKSDENELEESSNELFRLLIISAVFSLPLLLAMFLPFAILNHPWVQFGLSIPVMIIGFYHFGRSAFFALKNGNTNMDVLIILGSSAAFFYSLYGAIFGLGESFLFFETAATIITLVLLGNYIEKIAVNKTSSAIQELSKLQPKTAQLVTEIFGQETIALIETTSLKIGNIIKVNSGEQISADGKITFGNATIDESMLTGESIPVEKSVGDEVFAGTIVKNGSIKLEVTTNPRQSLVQDIIQLVKKAQNDKPSIQRLADKVSSIFVPLVVGIAVLTFIISYFAVNIEFEQAFLNSIAVLVISCPCAMGLATPTAVMVGVGKAAKNGVLIKGASTLEELQNVKHFIFDKTGTLTDGNFEIEELKTFNFEESKARRILFSLEQHSNHPLAESIKQLFANETLIQFIETKETEGLSIKGIDEENNTWEAGSFKILSKENTSIINKGFNIYLTKNKQLVCALKLKDKVKSEAKNVIQELINKGIEPILLSGDNDEKCQTVAKELGIKTVFSEQTPQQKLAVIESFSKQGKTVMIGDGINDAPALSKADIGISLGNASAVAIQSSKVILLKNDLNKILEGLDIGNQTVKTIKQNLFWAFSYNIVAIPLAAFGLLNPMWAAFFMAFSDIVVIGNSIRLKYKN